VLSQFSAILWAQIRTVRNRLPRSWAYKVISLFLLLVWYGAFALSAVGLARWIPQIPERMLGEWLGIFLLGLSVVWQVVPLVTLSSGWSLHLRGLRAFPIQPAVLLWIEVSLQVLMSAEFALPLAGVCVGLLRHPEHGNLAPLALLLLLPFNAFLAVALRELVLHSFARNRFRELFAVVIISLAILPQVLLRTTAASRLYPYLTHVANATGTLWHEVGNIALGHSTFASWAIAAAWLTAAYLVAAHQIRAAERLEQHGATPSAVHLSNSAAARFGLLSFLPGTRRDPKAAFIEKELRTLLRAPRFRVVFGMASLFSVVVFLSLTHNDPAGNGFLQLNFVPVVNLYGIVLLGDVLMWNVFGFDGTASANYFATPALLKTVIEAKNSVAILFVALQWVLVLGISTLFRLYVTPKAVLVSLCTTAVVTVHFLAVGNLLSVTMPRYVDPKETLRKQAGGQAQLWLFACVLLALVLGGIPVWAQWAFGLSWVLPVCFAVEFVLGIITYGIALQSSVERGWARREEIVNTLARNSSPLTS
jgi:ABC-2 type transport system permease protein